jgi:hypothetical protein
MDDASSRKFTLGPGFLGLNINTKHLLVLLRKIANKRIDCTVCLDLFGPDFPHLLRLHG